MYSPTTSVSDLPKVGPKLLRSLAILGISTVEDLLRYYPTRYLDFSKFIPISELRSGETVTVRGFIKTISSRFSFPSRKMLSEAVISDETGSIKVTWFNLGYVAESLKKGEEVLLSGKVNQYKNLLQLTNPIYEKVAKDHIHTGRLVPVYRLSDAIYPKTFRSLVHAALPTAEQITDILPGQTKTKYNIATIAETIQSLHFPESAERVLRAEARLAFEESFVQQLAVEQHKIQLKTLAAPSIPTNVEYIKTLLKVLPFSLTPGQKKVLWTILQDLEYKHPMNRLLQGDVGSGKTIVALLAALQAIHQGHQVVLLAPTEVLAKQHYDGMLKQSHALGLSSSSIGLFSRSFHEIGTEACTKAQSIQALQTGTVSLMIGTHALLQDNVLFKNLALIIIDEQHRFGVSQRKTLLSRMIHETHDRDAGRSNSGAQRGRQKGEAPRQWVPHLLSMSATPIPRTAALALYGDLEISTIDELPKDRLPIKTWVVPETKRAGAYEFVQKEITKGRQAFIITPLVEDSEKLQIKSAKAEYIRLQQKIFPKLKLGLVHGSLKGKEKDEQMLAFKNKETQVLVATSVIEIGIDIPNASVIIIEDAGRFGLAQLHQLRGRVGRGQHQSYCLLFSDADSSQERLEFFAHTSNGFSVAEYDMQTRGFGALFGTNQTGFNFKYGQYLTLEVLKQAKNAARDLIGMDKDLQNFPALRTQVIPLKNEVHLE